MNRLIHARLLLAIAIALTIGAVEIGSLSSPVASAPTGKTQLIVADSILMLPTITVHAPDSIPTLPVVLVRPTPAQLASTQTMVAGVSTGTFGATPSVSAGLPHVRLDMPYYSFGKMLPNVIKD
ncbi:MAG: hypothetical protein ABI127_05800 [Dokdonella sp.]